MKQKTNIRHPVGNEKQEGVQQIKVAPSLLSNREEELLKEYKEADTADLQYTESDVRRSEYLFYGQGLKEGRELQKKEIKDAYENVKLKILPDDVGLKDLLLMSSFWENEQLQQENQQLRDDKYHIQTEMKERVNRELDRQRELRQQISNMQMTEEDVLSLFYKFSTKINDSRDLGFNAFFQALKSKGLIK